MRVIQAFLLFLLVLGLGGCRATDRQAGGGDPSERAGTSIARVELEGMTCSSCGFAVKQVLQRLGGVVSAEVDYRMALATVRFDRSEVRPEDLTREIGRLGFGARLVSTTGS